MLVIRLRQQGQKDNIQFRVVVIDQRKRRDGSYIDNLGWYNPHLKNEADCVLHLDRLDAWTGKGAQMTDAVRDLVRKFRAKAAPQVEVAAPVAAPKKAKAAKAKK